MTKAKLKTSLIIVFLGILFLSLALPARAALVPCGASQDDPSTQNIDEAKACGFCDVFVLVNNVIRLVFILVPSVAVLMFIIGGLYMLTAAGRPEWFNKAKNVMTAAVIGLIILFVALVFLNTLFDALGVVEWTRLKGNWWTSEFWAVTCQAP